MFQKIGEGSHCGQCGWFSLTLWLPASPLPVTHKLWVVEPMSITVDVETAHKQMQSEPEKKIIKLRTVFSSH